MYVLTETICNCIVTILILHMYTYTVQWWCWGGGRGGKGIPPPLQKKKEKEKKIAHPNLSDTKKKGFLLYEVVKTDRLLEGLTPSPT